MWDSMGEEDLHPCLISIHVLYSSTERCSTILLDLLKQLKEKCENSKKELSASKENEIEKTHLDLASAYNLVNEELIKRIEELEETYEKETEQKLEIKRQILRQEMWIKIQVASYIDL